MHAAEHFVWAWETLDGRGQVSVGTSNSREKRADRGKNPFEVDAIALSNQAPRLSKIQNAALSAGSEDARNFPQPGVIVGQVSETEC